VSGQLLTVGIDASNLLQGGGRTHLVELLRAADPEAHGFGKVVVWGSRATLGLIEDRDWLVKRGPAPLDRGLIFRGLWQHFLLSAHARAERCDVLLIPGGSFSGRYRPVVAMCRNMLPFERTERVRYGFAPIRLRHFFLRFLQANTFRRADATIFLSDYAKRIIDTEVNLCGVRVAVIPHGVSDQARAAPKVQKSIAEYSTDRPFKVLYVSVIDEYKHQWHVIDAASQLRQRTGWPLRLELVGPSYGPSRKRLHKAMAQHDKEGKWVSYYGAVDNKRLASIYLAADLGLFASSCENMPNVLLETMAAGLPVVCSNRGPMPEILGNAGLYFNPEDPTDIAVAIEKMVGDGDLRSHYADQSFKRSQGYSWHRCASDTFEFLTAIHRDYHGRRNVEVG